MTLDDLTPEQLVCWDRDGVAQGVQSVWRDGCVLSIQDSDRDLLRSVSVLVAGTGSRRHADESCPFYEFVCDPVPHWQSYEDARVLAGNWARGLFAIHG